MTHGEWDLFLVGMIILCCVMSVFNALKNAHRGAAGYILSVSFLIFGGTVALYRSGAQIAYIDAGCVALLLLLGADFYFRAGTPPRKKR